ncbi:hypothetical protein [Pseudonocardia sp. TRM90224]|uniref:hypothetical protein n=1 Tax=Pseudonocardia sp. TRM90224 TaxID=2812678 RepID=UPI001E49346F|nr:hypothetical protein [Pseudonocardia sp. TRM90224]
MEFEDGPTGYPGFRVDRPPRLRALPITLRRIGRAKMTGIRFFSATVRGESFLFEPWLVTFVEERDRMRCVGVYRTDDESPDDDPAEPWLCVRRSVWERDADIDRAEQADDLRSYLAAGPQIVDRFLLTNRIRHPHVAEVTDAAISALADGVSVEPVRRPDSEWQYVEVDLADDRSMASIAYSPIVTRSDVLESVLSTWLPAVEDLADGDGLAPDGPLRISIERSVPELVNAQLWVQGRRTDRPEGT